MPVVNVKGYGNVNFPNGMDVNDIRDSLRRRYSDQTNSDLLQSASKYGAPIDNVAAPYKPSLMERAGQGIADVLSDTGIISNRYSAQQIGRNVANIGEMLPGIGDVAAVDDTIRAYNKGKYGEAALNAVGVAPLLGDAAIFAGVLAKNADLGALRKAKLLEDTGADRNRIWKETGWANDNGDWKFEIDDSQAQLTEKALKQSIVNDKGDVLPYKLADSGRFRDYVDQPHLAASYPELTSGEYRNIAGEGGSQQRLRSDILNKDYSEISVGRDQTPKDRLSTSLHELQHGIQSTEGFAKGGSPTQELLDDGRIKSLTNKISELEASGDYNYSDMKALLAEKNRLITNADDPFKQYQRLAGEAEARNVQTRLDMTPDERRAKPPWETLDVPEDELIYRGGSGVSKIQ
tara:strand:+ start:7126 stop:8340 length:1215 start_codon:yes stop_codon:yes gene_type:complete